MSNNEAYIASVARTAVGNLCGGLSALPAATLGSVAIKAALERAGLAPEAPKEVIMGCVLTGGQGQAPARQAALGADIPDSVPATTVNKVCGSGLHAMILSARAIMLGEVNVALAGGMESMSFCPYILPKARSGYRLGHGELVDMMVKDGLWDAFHDIHMGMCAESVAEEQKISRDEQDDFAVISYRRAIEATAKGSVRWEIAPVEIPQRKGPPKIFDEDEGPKIFDEVKMRKMSPAFDREKGTITAGNASSINDGAAAAVLASLSALKKYGLEPLARIVSWGFFALEPKRFTMAPVPAMKRALEKAGLGVDDIDFFEINEAFAVVPIIAMRELGIPIEKVNPLGGAISIGHPIGASGARILSTLLNVLRINKAKRGLATLCIGGGEGIAMIVEAL